MTTEKARTVEPKETAVEMQRLSKHVSLATYTHATIEELLEAAFSVRSMLRLCQQGHQLGARHNPCGGGVEYLHRDPASRRRRRKGKSQI
jgi:hypothetical protein